MSALAQPRDLPFSKKPRWRSTIAVVLTALLATTPLIAWFMRMPDKELKSTIQVVLWIGLCVIWLPGMLPLMVIRGSDVSSVEWTTACIAFPTNFIFYTLIVHGLRFARFRFGTLSMLFILAWLVALIVGLSMLFSDTQRMWLPL